MVEWQRLGSIDMFFSEMKIGLAYINDKDQYCTQTNLTKPKLAILADIGLANYISINNNAVFVLIYFSFMI